MTKLECSVSNCLHYSDHYCCKSAIMVEGQGAKDTAGTCCASFAPNTEGSFKNVFKSPESKLDVDCEATQCTYNNNMKCHADHIDISGDGAQQSGQTKCATFKAK